MELESAASDGFRGTLEVEITADLFPELTRRCQGDPEFQELIADNLARVLEEYLKAAEAQISSAASEFGEE